MIVQLLESDEGFKFNLGHLMKLPKPQSVLNKKSY